MKPLKLIFTLYFSSTINCIFTSVQDHRVNHSAAKRRCENESGLAPNFYFPRVIVSLTDYGSPHDSVRYSHLRNVQLEDGESAWVAGYAKYSGSMYNHCGCYPYDNQNRFAASDNQGHRGFYQCSEYCEKQASGTYYENLYFLINTTSCVCLKNVTQEKRTACPENTDDGLLLELYKRKTRYQKDGHYQCATLKYNSNRSTWETLTSKCWENKYVQCTHIRKTIVCKKHTLITPYCDVNISGTWLNGVKECNTIEGMLAPYYSEQLRSSLYWANQYWLGSVSAYKLHTQRGDACLSVTRVGDQLVLQPDDCEAKNKFICAIDIKSNNDDNDEKTAKSTLPYTPTNEQTTHSYVIPTSVNSSQSSQTNEQITHSHVIPTSDKSAPVNKQQTLSHMILTPANGIPSKERTTISNAIPASKSLPAITSTIKLLITRPMASSVGTNTVLIIVACCSVVVGGGCVAITCVICRRKKQSIKYCKKHVTPQPSSNTCITDISMADVPESDYATVDETNSVLAKSDAASVPPGNSLNITASDGTRDKNTSQEKQTRNTLTRKNNIELCENIPPSRKALDNRNKDENDTDASLSDDYNVLSFTQPAQPKKQEEYEAHVYDHMPVMKSGQKSDEKARNESKKEDENVYDTTASVTVLLHGDYATTRSLQKVGSGEYDTSQSVHNMLRSNQHPDDTYSHIPSALDADEAKGQLKDTNFNN